MRPSIAIVLGIALGIGLAGCERLSVEQLATDPLAFDGNVEETPWAPRALCIEFSDNSVDPLDPSGAGEPPRQRFVELVQRADEFGNERWGAGYSAGLILEVVEDIDGTTESRLRGELIGRATVFETERDLVSVALDGYSRENGDARISADLVFLGRYVYPLFVHEGSFSRARDYTHRVLVVPVVHPMRAWTVNLDIEVWATLGYSVSGQLFPTGLGVRVEPYAAVTATATASVGPEIIKAGVTGSLELIEVGLPIQAAFAVSGHDEGGVVVGWSSLVGLEAEWLDGRIDVGIEVPGRKLAETLAEWDGHGSNTVLAEGGGSVRVRTGATDCGPAALLPGLPGPELGLERVPGPRAELDPSSSISPLDGIEALALLPPGRGSARVRAELLTALTAALVEDPTLAEEFVAASERAPDLVAALGAASSSEAASALVALAQEESANEELRIRAIANVGLMSSPPSHAVDALLRLLENTEGALEETTSYALGNLAATLRGSDPSRASALTAVLLARSYGPASAARRATQLRALANTRADAGLDRLSLVAHDASEDPSVRQVAALALEAIAGSQAPDHVSRSE